MRFFKGLFGGRAKMVAPGVGYGYAPDDPIRCDGPAGERAFIAKLRCPRGHELRGHRVGSFDGKCTDPAHHEGFLPDERPEEHSLVDRYELTCTGGEHSCALYFDMYHPDAPEQRAPDGLI